MLKNDKKASIHHPSPSESSIVRNRIEDIVKLCEATVWTRDPKVVYQGVVNALAEVLNCEDVNIYILAVTGDHLAEYAAHGQRGEIFKSGARTLHVTTGRTRQIIETKMPIIMDYLNPHHEDISPYEALQSGHICAVSIPLIAGDEVLGLCNLNYKKSQNWEELDIDYYRAVGRVLGVMVQSAQMAQKNVELQVLVERKRLSEEIHDNLSQLLSILKLAAETAMISFEKEDWKSSHKNLERLVSTSREALKILREEILYLRAPTSQTEGLVFGLEQCLLRFSERWDVDVNLEVVDINQPVVVSLQTELQLTRILHEALSNTLRHASASEVSVILGKDKKHLMMLISDNGCGFDIESVPTERLGIRIMKERADSLGGNLSIKSSEKKGTNIKVEIPYPIR